MSPGLDSSCRQKGIVRKVEHRVSTPTKDSRPKTSVSDTPNFQGIQLSSQIPISSIYNDAVLLGLRLVVFQFFDIPTSYVTNSKRYIIELAAYSSLSVNVIN